MSRGQVVDDLLDALAVPHGNHAVQVFRCMLVRTPVRSALKHRVNDALVGLAHLLREAGLQHIPVPLEHGFAGLQRVFQKPLHDAALGQDPVLEAPLVLVIAAVYERTQVKYGTERSPRYVHLEAGHAAQKVLLQAAALDLGAVPIGAFYDARVQAILGLPADHQPLYLIPIGHPK